MRNDVGEMLLERQMQPGNASRGEAMPAGQLVQRTVDERNFRNLVMEGYFQAAGARRAFSPPAARRVEAYRATPDGPPSTITSLKPVMSRISLMPFEGRVTSRVFPLVFIWR